MKAKKVKGFWLSLLVVISMFLNIPLGQAAAVKHATVTIHFIDVGQGDATLIQTGKENILIDGGSKTKGKTVYNYLKKHKVKTLDSVIATHPDSDHLGGLIYIIQNMKVKNVYAPKVSHTTNVYRDFLLAIKKKKLTIKEAKMNKTIKSNAKNVSFKFLGPVKNYAKSDLNNWSAVLQMKVGSKKVLFTGDAEKKAENDLLAKKLLGKVDILKVSHHGSKDATTQAFLNKTRPTFSVISVGKGNRYKHPTKETLNRLKKVKSKVYRTDKNGTVKLQIKNNKIYKK